MQSPPDPSHDLRHGLPRASSHNRCRGPPRASSHDQLASFPVFGECTVFVSPVRRAITEEQQCLERKLMKGFQNMFNEPRSWLTNYIQLPKLLASFVISCNFMDGRRMIFSSGAVPLATRVITSCHCIFIEVGVSGSVPPALGARVITNQRMDERLAWSPRERVITDYRHI